MQVCELLVYQKKVVVPFIRQSALTHETMGDEIMADTIRYSPSSHTVLSLPSVYIEAVFMSSALF